MQQNAAPHTGDPEGTFKSLTARQPPQLYVLLIAVAFRSPSSLLAFAPRTLRMLRQRRRRTLQK